MTAEQVDSIVDALELSKALLEHHMTNGDWLRSLSPEELADWLVMVELMVLAKRPAMTRDELREDWLEWLEEEREHACLKNAEGVSKFFDKLFPQPEPVSKADEFGKSEQLANGSSRIHARWNLDGTCSLCGKHSLSTYGNFCCYCGADMSEDVSESNTADKEVDNG